MRFSVAVVALLLLVAPLGAPAAYAAPEPLALPSWGPAVSFLQASQNIGATDYNALSEVNFYLGSRIELDGGLAGVNATMLAYLTARVQALQNADGGYGDWAGDRSTAGATARALEALNQLTVAPANPAGTRAFLDGLLVTGATTTSGGYVTSSVDRTPSMTSTSNAIRAYAALGQALPNASATAAFVRNHQNADGGFGLLSDRAGGVADLSTVTSTWDAIISLDLLASAPDASALAVSYLQGLQNSDGGFGGTTGNTTSRVAYTYDAVEALGLLGAAPVNPGAAVTFVLSNELPTGGFLENALDAVPGVHTVYFAVRALKLLNATFDSTLTSSFVETAIPSENDGGFGNQPGILSIVRFTYDHVFALNALGARPTDRGAAAAYLLSLRNPDGGYGTGGNSTADSTARAVMALQMMGEALPDPAGTSLFLRRLQNADGGFGIAPGAPSSLTYTYRAIAGLEVLGDRANSTAAAAAFVRARQLPDGGFEDVQGSARSTVVFTSYALLALRLLGASPNAPAATEAFLGSAQNADGGYRHAPTAVTAPLRFSAALYTQAALQGLRALGAPLPNQTATETFLQRLQAHDGAFSEHLNFTSTGNATYSAILALDLLAPGAYNTAPQLSGLAAAPSVANSTTAVTFSATYTDGEGQLPTKVLLDVNGERHVMSPVAAADLDSRDGKAYAYPLTLPIGTYAFRVVASDGFAEAALDSAAAALEVRFDPGPSNNTTPPPPPPPPPPQNNTTVPPQNNTTVPPQNNTTVPPPPPPPPVRHAPLIEAYVDPPAGTPSTVFAFHVNYTQPEGFAASYVRIEIDTGDWIPMLQEGAGSPSTGVTFSYVAVLLEGNHTFRVVAFDGLNAVQTPWIAGPDVASDAAVRPGAATFAVIKATILARYGVVVGPLDVERGIFEGAYAWLVHLPGADHFVSLDGASVLDDPLPPPGNGPGTAAPQGPPMALIALAAALAAAAAAALAVARRRRARREP